MQIGIVLQENLDLKAIIPEVLLPKKNLLYQFLIQRMDRVTLVNN